MGLAEEITNALQSKANAEAAQIEETERQNRERSKAELKAQSNRVQAEVDRKAQLVSSLSPLLDLVGARAQLAEVKKVWTVGEIDKSPTLEEDGPPRLALALRYQYRTAIFHPSRSVRNTIPLEDGWSTTDPYWSIRDTEASLTIAVGLPNLACVEYRRGDMCSKISHDYVWRMTDGEIPLGKLPVSELIKDVVVDQPLPLALEKAAQRLLATQFPPTKVHLPWYKRILG